MEYLDQVLQYVYPTYDSSPPPEPPPEVMWFPSPGTIILCTFAAVLVGTTVGGARAAKLPGAEFPWQFRLAAALRTPVLMFIVIPLSFLNEQKRVFRLHSRELWAKWVTGGEGEEAALAAHEKSVAIVVEQIKRWNEAGRPGRLRTARPTWASMSTKIGGSKGADTHKIEVRHLNRILDIDEENLTVTCEPSVTMGELAHALVPRNLSLQTHVEMETITIGGVACGFGIETNSHRYGFFQESALAYELVDSKGEVHNITAESDPELFYAMPWSCGTTGFLLSLKVRLVRTKPYMRIRYEPTHSREELAARMTELTMMTGDAAPDFVEATLYTVDDAVIQCAWYEDAPTTREAKRAVNRINDFWKPFYFRWVETFLLKGAAEEVVPLKHFLHRFSRSIFWELEDMIPFSNHPLYRCLWGWLGAPEVGLLKLFQGPVIRKAAAYAHVVQESIIPIDRMAEGVLKFDEWYGVYPLLVFPVRVVDRGAVSGMIHPDPKDCTGGKNASGDKWGMWVDIGAYGVPEKIKRGEPYDCKKSIRDMEHWTRDNNGWNATYCDLFCTQKEFRDMFDHSLIDAARVRLGSTDAFPEPYAKVKPEAGIADLTDELAAEAKAAGGNGARRATSPRRRK